MWSWHRAHWAVRLTNVLIVAETMSSRSMLRTRGFSMEPEITTKLARMNVEIVECPVTYRPRARAEGKKIRATDFLRYLAAMIRYRFSGRLLEAHILPTPAAQAE